MKKHQEDYNFRFDEEKIDELFNKLRQYKRKHPYLRVGQIISNLDPKRNVFNIEDSELFENITKELEKE